MEKNAKIYVAGHRGLVGSAIVRKLEEEGYITREVNPENRRKNQIFITPKGKELTEKIIKYNLEWEEQMGFKDLNPIFFKELHKLSSKCLNDLNSD